MNTKIEETQEKQENNIDLNELYKSIINRTRQNSSEISELIKLVSTLVTNKMDMAMMGSVLTNLIDSNLKNDKLLIDVANSIKKTSGTKSKEELNKENDEMLKLSTKDKIELLEKYEKLKLTYGEDK